MTRILIAPRWARSHVVTNLALAQELVCRGHEVYMYALASDVKFIADAGYRPLEMPVTDLLPGFYNCVTPEEFRDINTEFARRIVRDLLGRFRELDIELVVSGIYSIGAALAAEKAGLPWASLGTAPFELSDEIAGHGTGLVPVHQLRRELELPERPGTAIEQGRSPLLHLMRWTKEFDVTPPVAQARHIGPMVLGDDAPAPDWLDRVGRDRPLVLVAGTTVPFESATADLMRLLETSARALHALGVDGIVTPATANIPELEPPGPNVRVMKFLPHDLVIGRASLVISHGGWGTVCRALANGKPMINIPLFFDQPFNAQLCEKGGFGVAMDVASLEIDRLADTVRRLLSAGSRERERTEAYAAALRDRPSPARLAADQLLALAR